MRENYEDGQKIYYKTKAESTIKEGTFCADYVIIKRLDKKRLMITRRNVAATREDLEPGKEESWLDKLLRFLGY